MSGRGPGPGGPEESPIGSGGRGVLLLAVAVVIGIVVLQAIDSDGPAVEVGTSTRTTLPRVTTSSLPTVSTAPLLRAPAEVTVLPANGAGVTGLGARVQAKLQAGGYTSTLAPVTATEQSLATSIIQHKPGFAGEAQQVATVLGLPPTVVQPLGQPPVDDTRDAAVIVVAGADLAQLLPAGSTATTSG